MHPQTHLPKCPPPQHLSSPIEVRSRIWGILQPLKALPYSTGYHCHLPRPGGLRLHIARVQLPLRYHPCYLLRGHFAYRQGLLSDIQALPQTRVGSRYCVHDFMGRFPFLRRLGAIGTGVEGDVLQTQFVQMVGGV
jgi:hypothetical protein